MSLPSYATFYKDNIEVKRLFTNCGWFSTERSIISGINTTLGNHEPFEWDSVEAYGVKFIKDDIKINSNENN